MNLRIAAFVAAVLFGMLVIGPIGAAGHSSETAAGRVTAIRVSGTFIDAEGVGTFSGTLDIQRFAAIDHRRVVRTGAAHVTSHVAVLVVIHAAIHNHWAAIARQFKAQCVTVSVACLVVRSHVAAVHHQHVILVADDEIAAGVV